MINIPPEGQQRVVMRRASAFDVMDLMAAVVNDAAADPNMTEFVRRHPMNARQIHEFIYQTILMEPDVKNHQVVKTPAAILRTRRANCVGYATFAATLAKLNGLGGHFRAVSFKKNNLKPRHIYVVTRRGIIIDPVQGQQQDGETSVLERKDKYGRFNQEVKYCYKFDKRY